MASRAQIAVKQHHAHNTRRRAPVLALVGVDLDRRDANIKITKRTQFEAPGSMRRPA
jgi:hypothetical protein